ncbi:hypothetical protein L2725_07175 [Shewanella corallii]|uniref:Lipoprotein n=1 Tax=Shewanella corallii TaxID=560080 RepID=A0ABT0N536_9GAMM|nr:hypothetical protein [Shewanella corallii]MCL2913569.1 hypothetical protein [Shewanella corallii]
MKYLCTAAILASLILVAGCDDDDDEPVEPPLTVANIDTAASFELVMNNFDGPSGELGFTLVHDQGVRLNGAASYTIHYLGMPAEPSVKPKSWKKWHTINTFSCQAGQTEPCQGALDALDDEGNYRFIADGLNWDKSAVDSAVGVYKVAVEVHGALASNPVEFYTAE